MHWFVVEVHVPLRDLQPVQGLHWTLAESFSVSVSSGAGKTLDELTTGIPNKQVGVTTVESVRRAGGDVIPSPTASNPNHCTLCGITPQKAEELMTPTVRNPNVR